MADEVAHGKVVLAAIVSGGGSLPALDFAVSKLVLEHFPDKVQRDLFRLLDRYARKNGGIMTREALGDLMRGKPAGTVLRYGEAYDAVAAVPLPEEHAFLHSVSQLRELAAKRITGEGLATGKLILDGSVHLDDGREVGGYVDAQEYVLSVFAEAAQLGSESDTPEGNAAVEAEEVMAAYARAKALRMSGAPVGVQLGLPAVDKFLGGGLGKGLALVVAPTSVGKSSLVLQAAWHNAVMEGRNVLVFTTEQHRDEVRIKLVSRHSRHPKFGLGRGLDTSKIRSGWLSADEEKAFDWVLSDLKGGGYGEIQVVQLPEHCTVAVMAARAESLARRVMPEFVVADYLQLFDPPVRTRDSREHENQSGIVKTAHRWAQTAFHGRGVPLFSPWQPNQAGAGALRGGGGFSLDTHMSQTKEASNTAGVVLALAMPEEDISKGRNVVLQLSVEKNRDGVRGVRFQVTADYATSYFSDRETEPEQDFLGLDD
jgi:hypothetical protein